MSSLISTMPPTDLLIKQHESNSSPRSISNISSPNTTVVGGNFSPAQQSQTQQQSQQQQQHPSQQLQQQQAMAPAAAAALNGGNGISGSGGGASSAFPFFGAGGNVSPTEGSTASDPGGISNSAASTNAANPSIPTTTTSGNSSNGTEEDFAAGIGTSTTYCNNVGFGSSASSIGSNGNSANCGIPANGMGGTMNSGTVMPTNGNFNVTGSPMKQFTPTPQQQQQLQLQQQQLFPQQQFQQQQQKFFSPASSTTAITSPSVNLLDANAQQHQQQMAMMLSNQHSTACYGMPQSAPSQTIRNPFEEDEQSCSVTQRPMSAKPGMLSSVGSPLPSPTYFEQFRNQRRQQMPELPHVPPGAFIPGTREHQLAAERFRLPYTFHAQQRRQLATPYPVPGVGPAQHMGMMLRLPPPYMQMNPALMAGKHPFLGPGGPQMIMTPAGPMFMGPNGQMIPPGMIGARPPSIATPQQPNMPNSGPARGAAGAIPSGATTGSTTTGKKESKKKEAKLTKKQQQALQQQQQAEAEAARQQQQASCSLMNGIMMPGAGNPVAAAAAAAGMPLSLPDSGGGNFSPGSCRSMSANEIKQRMQQNATPMGGALSPNNFKVPGRSPPFQRQPAMKLFPMPEQRVLDGGDCIACKQKINQQRRGIKCTAVNQGCGMCFHMDCANLSQEAFSEFLKDQRLEWICHFCTQRKPICFAF